MASKKGLRKQFFVDPKVQGALVWRVVLYWCTCLATMMMMLLCWRILTGPARLFYYHFDDMWFYYGPALIASAIMLPVIVIDLVRMSNRFVGPMLRLRRSMQALARGEHVKPIRFRDNDYWQDFAGEFNAVVARVQGEMDERSVAVAAGDHASETAPTRSGKVESVARSSTVQQVSSSASDKDEDDSRLAAAGAHPE